MTEQDFESFYPRWWSKIGCADLTDDQGIKMIEWIWLRMRDTQNESSDAAKSLRAELDRVLGRRGLP